MTFKQFLQKIFRKKKKKAPPVVVVVTPGDEIDPLTGQKRKKTVLPLTDPYEIDTMKLFDKLFYDFTSNNIQLSEVKRKYTEKVLNNLGERSPLNEMLRNLLYYKKIDIIDVDKAYLELEKNKSKFTFIKNAVVNFNVQDKINFEDEILKTGIPVLKIVTDIRNLYNTIDSKKYFDFKVKIKELYDKQLKYYRDTYGYLKQIEYNLIAPNILDKPIEIQPDVPGIGVQTGIDITPAIPFNDGTYPDWKNKDYSPNTTVYYQGKLYKTVQFVYGTNNNPPNLDGRWLLI
jgi:hypothetical protein